MCLNGALWKKILYQPLDTHTLFVDLGLHMGFVDNTTNMDNWQPYPLNIKVPCSVTPISTHTGVETGVTH